MSVKLIARKRTNAWTEGRREENVERSTGTGGGRQGFGLTREDEKDAIMTTARRWVTPDRKITEAQKPDETCN